VSQRSARLLWLGVVVLSAGILGVLVYRAWPLLYPDELARAPLSPACDLHSVSCSVAFEDGSRVTLSIEPRPIPLVKPLRLTVTLEGLDPEGVEIDFAGLNMNMGYNRVRLQAVDKGSYAGQGMLPVCVRDHMAWEAKVLLATPAGYLVAPFRFDTYRLGRPGP
jgi:hypothetical protein